MRTLEPLPSTDYQVYPGCDPPSFIREFLEGKRITIEAFCMSERIDPSDFERLAHESVTEWELSEETHRDRKEAVKHLINHIRIKIREQRNNPKRQGGYAPGSDAGRAAEDLEVAQAILRWINPGKDY